MALKYLTDLNLLQNEIQNAIAHPLAVAPSNAKEGQFYVNTTDHKFYVYLNNAWKTFDDASDVEAAIQAVQDDLDAYKTSNDAAVALKANDSEVMHLANVETATGIKTFSAGLKSGETIAADSNDTTVPTTAWVKSTITTAENGLVHTTGNESIAGTKTFTGAIDGTAATVTVATQTAGDNSTNAASTAYADAAAATVNSALEAYEATNDAAVALKANDNAVVHLSGAETIADVKTFSASPLVPTADLNDSSTKAASTAFVGAEIADYTYDKDTIDSKIDAKDSLPEQTGHAGEWLTTDGTDASWSALPIATDAVLGVVKQGSNITIANDGTISSPIASVAGKTGAVTLDKSDVGLGNVDNTADLDKPISTLTQAALDLKANAADVYTKTETYNKTEIDGMLAAGLHYRGSVATYADLPATGQAEGDMYNVVAADPTHDVKAGDNVIWVAEHDDVAAHWDVVSGVVDLSAYSTSAEIAAAYVNKTDYATDKAALEADIATAQSTAEAAAHVVAFTNPELTPSNGVATWQINHTAGSNVLVQIKDGNSGEIVYMKVVQANNSLTITFNAASTVAAGTYTAVVTGNGAVNA